MVLLQKKRKVFIIGHKNPDTDSICSAIAYAALKNQIAGNHFEARRAGEINEETRFVLKYFGVKKPKLLEDVRTQVKDIDIRYTEGAQRDFSLMKAWKIMKNLKVVTLPVTKEERLEGIITIGDITRSYMEEYDCRVLSKARTSYKNILETLEGEMIVGDTEGYFEDGKVQVAAANPDFMESFIEKGDLIILENRYESQLCCIEMEAACIVVCSGSPVSRTIRSLAQSRGCRIICTPFDTFTVARLINQSMPISYVMSTENLNVFSPDDYIEDVHDIMVVVRHRYFPVVSNEGDYVGMLSRRNLLGARKKQVILVDHNEKTQAVNGLGEAEILEIIDHHRLGTIETMSPVFFRNQPLGCTATIVYQMYQENGVEIKPQIAGLLCSAIISDTLLFRSPTCTEVDKAAAQQLAKIAGIEPESYAMEMFSAGSNLSSKTEEEIFYQDFKEFTVEDMKIGVGQISSMSQEELEELKKRLLPYMKSEILKKGLDIMYFMLTNIWDESTLLLCVGDRAEDVLFEALNVRLTDDTVRLPGVVSRKKQLLPTVIAGIQLICGKA